MNKGSRRKLILAVFASRCDLGINLVREVTPYARTYTSRYHSKYKCTRDNTEVYVFVHQDLKLDDDEIKMVAAYAVENADQFESVFISPEGF